MPMMTRVQAKTSTGKPLPKMNLKQTAKLNQDVLEIRFVYSSRLVAQVKTLSGRKWHPAQKMWSCPPSFENYENLVNWEFKLDTKAEIFWNNINKSKITIDFSLCPLYNTLNVSRKHLTLLKGEQNARK